MTATQPELPIDPPAREDLSPLFTIRADHPNVRWFLALLKKEGWQTRKQVIQHANRLVTNHHIRWVRALAEAAGTQVVKGQDGFNHIENCTVDEINYAANQSIAQGKRMLKYGIGLRRVAHERIG